MTFSEYGRTLEFPMTEVYKVILYDYYEWDEGRLFRHDETGLYAWIADSGCSCHYYLSEIRTVEELMSRTDWTPLDRQVPEILRYIDSDKDQGSDSNGSAWRVAETARLHIFLREERAKGTA